MNDILAIMSRADDTVAQTRLVMIPVLEAKQLLDLADTIVGDPDTAIELELGNEYLPTVQVIVFPHSTVKQLIATACAQASSPPSLHAVLILLQITAFGRWISTLLRDSNMLVSESDLAVSL